ncbi:MAG: ABC transporter ATP-binding protein [Planctomycetes bacterium]|nr:ABC transporter ATP-binding protein [Planctomycetota bacterium]
MISGSTTESSLARDSILEVCNLVVEFSSADGTIVAVDRLSLTVPRNRAVALIGESGCGKSSTVFAVPRLLPASGRIVGGSITYAHDPGGPGIDLTTLPEKELESVRGRQIGMIMQGSQCLNPAYSVGQEIVRVLITDGENRQSAWTRARKLLEEVGIGDAERCMLQHHHELSGGLQQRVVLAMARARLRFTNRG